MRKLTLTLAVCLVASAAFAQRSSVRLNVGYALPSQQNAIGTERVTTVTASGADARVTNIYGTSGAGFNVDFGYTYMINDYFGGELGLNFFSRTTITEEEAEATMNGAEMGGLTRESNGYQLRVQPALVFYAASPDAKIKPYGRMGLILPVTGVTNVSVSAFSNDPSVETSRLEVESETSAAFSIGFFGGVGVDYSLTENLSIHGEIVYNALNLRAKSTEITAYEEDKGGVTITLSDLPEYAKQIEYVDELTSSSNSFEINDDADLTKPEERLINPSNYNSFGINLGVRYAF